jgi:hypothetical protein
VAGCVAAIRDVLSDHHVRGLGEIEARARGSGGACRSEGWQEAQAAAAPHSNDPGPPISYDTQTKNADSRWGHFKRPDRGAQAAERWIVSSASAGIITTGVPVISALSEFGPLNVLFRVGRMGLAADKQIAAAHVEPKRRYLEEPPQA